VSLESKFERVKPVIIGLWRFTYKNHKEPKWCCTWRHRGIYYDTYPRKTPGDALDSVWKNWQDKLKRGRK
jgi:hypothetical protein